MANHNLWRRDLAILAFLETRSWSKFPKRMEDLATNKMFDNWDLNNISGADLNAAGPFFSSFAAKLLNQQKILVLKAAPRWLYLRFSVT